MKTKKLKKWKRIYLLTLILMPGLLSLKSHAINAQLPVGAWVTTPEFKCADNSVIPAAEQAFLTNPDNPTTYFTISETEMVQTTFDKEVQCQINVKFKVTIDQARSLLLISPTEAETKKVNPTCTEPESRQTFSPYEPTLEISYELVPTESIMNDLWIELPGYFCDSKKSVKIYQKSVQTP